MVILKLLAAMLLFAPLCYAAISDFRHMIVPNWVSGLIVLGFVLFATVTWGTIDVRMHLVIAAVFFGISLLCWFAGWLGGGDVKLLGAVGLWLGTPYAFAFLFILAVTSTIMSGTLLIMRRLTRHTEETVPAAFKPILRMAHSGQFAYAIPIVMAALATLPRHFF